MLGNENLTQTIFLEFELYSICVLHYIIVYKGNMLRPRYVCVNKLFDKFNSAVHGTLTTARCICCKYRKMCCVKI